MRKAILISIFFLLQVYTFAATRYWVGGGSSANWNATSPTNWSATDGGSNNASVPGASDDVIFNGNGASANTNSTISASLTILSLTFTSGYTATVTENAAQTLTIAGNFTDNTAHNWTINSTSTSALNISAASTITSGGKTWPGNVNLSNANTKTLSGDWTITGALTMGSAETINSNTITCAGLSWGANIGGTTSFKMTGGTLSSSGGTFQNNLELAGNITVSGTIVYQTGTLLYTSGTITTTSSTLQIAATTTLNTAGVTWNNVTFSGSSSTITLSSALTVGATLTLPAATLTFAGAGGFTCATLTASPTGAVTYTLVNGNTYTVTGALNCFTSRTGSIALFTSDHATNKAILTLNSGATCNVLASFTRIDASNGRTIWTFNGTVTTCLNINQFTDLKTVSKTFVQ